MSMVGFPLLLIPLAIHTHPRNSLPMPGVSLADPLFRLKLVSGSDWPVTLSDILLALGILMLLLEVIKGAAAGREIPHRPFAVVDRVRRRHGRCTLWPKFASSTYFLLTLLALADFVSGIALRGRRRMQVAPAAAVSPRATQKADVPADSKPDIGPVEPRFEREPEPAPPPPPAPSAPPAPPVPAADRSPNPCCSIIRSQKWHRRPSSRASRHRSPPLRRASRNRSSRPSRNRSSWRANRSRRWLPRSCSRATVRRPRPRRRSTDSSNSLPHPGSGALHLRCLVRPVGRDRVRGGGAPQAQRLREMLGGCDQLRDKGRVGRRSTHLRVRPLGFLARPGPVRRKPALRPRRRRRLARGLVDRSLTSQAEVRLNCRILGRYRPCHFGAPAQGPCRSSPICSGSTCEHGLRNIYQLCLGSPARHALSLNSGNHSGAVPKRGDLDILTPASLDHGLHHSLNDLGLDRHSRRSSGISPATRSTGAITSVGFSPTFLPARSRPGLNLRN